MKEFIIENMEVIIGLITMVVTWVCGKLVKKHTKLSNKLIPIQNIAIMLIAIFIYYLATGDFSLVIASGSPIATLIYDTIHNLEKYEEDKEE